jgi:hypothetical protein
MSDEKQPTEGNATSNTGDTTQTGGTSLQGETTPAGGTTQSGGTAPNVDPIDNVDKKNATGEHSPGGSGDSVADDVNQAANQLEPPD